MGWEESGQFDGVDGMEWEESGQLDGVGLEEGGQLGGVDGIGWDEGVGWEEGGYPSQMGWMMTTFTFVHPISNMGSCLNLKLYNQLPTVHKYVHFLAFKGTK